MRQKTKFLIIVISEFVIIMVILILIFFAGKKVYTITFDINGGTLLNGDLVQKVTQGQNATPPIITKEGCFFLAWEGKYLKVTKDATIKAIWEYETTDGIIYNIVENANYCTIKSCYQELNGDIFIGAYYNDLKVLGIEDNAFKNCKGIENVYLLDGIINIGESAFEGCTSLKSIVIPDTVKTISKNAFKDCINLENISLGKTLYKIEDGAFSNCQKLNNVVIPLSVINLGYHVFDTKNLIINVYFDENEIPKTWHSEWSLYQPTINYSYVEKEIEPKNRKEK